MQTWLRFIVTVAVASGASAFGAGFAWSAQHARGDAIDRMSFRAERAASSISDAVQAARSTVEALAAQPGLTQAFDRSDDCTLTTQGSDVFSSVRLDLVSAEGRVRCSSEPGAVEQDDPIHAGSDWLAEVAAEDRTVVSWRATDAATQQPALVIAAPVVTDGTFTGAVTLFLHQPETASALAIDLVPTEQASVTIVDRAAGTLVDSSEAPRGRPSTTVEDWPVNGKWTGIDGSVRLFGSSDVPDSDWRVYVGTPRSVVLHAAQGALLRELLVGAVALIALAASVWVLSRRVVRPLQRITRAVEAASANPGRDKVTAGGIAELVVLAREFNTMLDMRAGHETQLAHLATHDSLTGLPNRALLREDLAQALSADAGGDGVAVLFCGLRDLETVNDSLGHVAGDRLFAAAADRLRSVMRRGDTLARFGGDAFAVVCRDTSSRHAIRVAERLHQSLTEPFRGIGDGDISLAAAVGIATAGGGTSAGLDQLLREADTALREAKSTGRPWSLFDDSLHRRASERLLSAEELRRAIGEEELVVFYQPVHSVSTGALIGAEALVRWQHPTRGLLSPSEFIALAEENGQIAALGNYVLVRACREAAGWATAGHPVRVSVNVAIDQLREGFIREVRDALSDSGLRAHLLCLEITESSIMTDVTRIADVLAGLRRLGVQVAIDDFGTGYSSLSWLHRLPLDELKIDRSFIMRVSDSASEQHLVKAIVGMAKALHLTVVSEGVETDHQLDVIARLGSDFAQGYLFNPPMPAQAFASQLTAAAETPATELAH